MLITNTVRNALGGQSVTAAMASYRVASAQTRANIEPISPRTSHVGATKNERQQFNRDTKAQTKR